MGSALSSLIALMVSGAPAAYGLRAARHNACVMRRPVLFVVLSCLLLQGCITRATDVKPSSTDPAEFLGWSCVRIDDELDTVQYRASDVAYAVDERAGNNILALGLGVMVFWPALMAMRPDGLEAVDLARLKGRFDALTQASRSAGCPPASELLSEARAAALPLALGEHLVYEDRDAAPAVAQRRSLRVDALRRTGVDYSLPDGGLLRQDHAGNVSAAPPGELLWPHLLRNELPLGAVTAGEMFVAGDPLARARLRGQVVAVGPQEVAGRRFDVAVVELFGDAQRGEAYTRVDGAIVFDRQSGVLLRLDLRSASPAFSLRRRLVRVEPVPSVAPAAPR